MKTTQKFKSSGGAFRFGGGEGKIVITPNGRGPKETKRGFREITFYVEQKLQGVWHRIWITDTSLSGVKTQMKNYLASLRNRQKSAYRIIQKVLQETVVYTSRKKIKKA